MATDNLYRSRPTPLPAKMDDWERKIKSVRMLNDYVEDVHRALWDGDPKYREFLEAVWDSDAVEGSLAIDNTMAAMMIREKAKDIDGNPVGKEAGYCRQGAWSGAAPLRGVPQGTSSYHPRRACRSGSQWRFRYLIVVGRGSNAPAFFGAGQ